MLRNPRSLSGKTLHLRHYLPAIRVQGRHVASIASCVTPIQRRFSPTTDRIMPINLRKQRSRITNRRSTWRKRPKSLIPTPWIYRPLTSRDLRVRKVSLPQRKTRRSWAHVDQSNKPAAIMPRSRTGTMVKTMFSTRSVLNTLTTSYHLMVPRPTKKITTRDKVKI